MLRLHKENPHVPFYKLYRMKKEQLIDLISDPFVKQAGMDLQKTTLLDILNYELNCDVKRDI